MTDDVKGLAKPIGAQITDQLLHMSAAILTLGPLMFFPCFFTAIWAGFCCGMIREVTQAGDPVKLANFGKALHGGSLLDIGFWTIGSAIIWLIIHH